MRNSKTISRRGFLESASATALAGRAALAAEKPVRVGVIGTGNRGSSLLRAMLGIAGVEVRAVCDLDEGKLTNAQDLVEKRAGKRPEPYGRNERDYRRLLERADLDAVVIATSWEWHAPVAVEAMKAGKYAAIEVPCALTIEDCWRLVDTRESLSLIHISPTNF